MPRIPRIPAPLEWREQEALFTWIQLMTGQEPRFALAHHNANGEFRTKRTGAKLQRMGVLPGIPDIHLPIAAWHYQAIGPIPGDHEYYGCWIELKRLTGGEATEAQRIIHGLLRLYGHYVAVCHGWVEAAQVLAWYLHREDLATGALLRVPLRIPSA